MRKKQTFRSKITRAVVLMTACFCVLVGGTAASTAAAGLYRNFTTFTELSAELSLSDLKFYIRTAVSASRIITENDSILDALENNNNAFVVSGALAQLHTVTQALYGAELYDTQRVYTTSNVGDAPAFDELAAHPLFAAFAGDADRNEFYWLRTDTMPKIYNDNRYDQASGMYTYVKKIIKEEAVLGYLLMDFNPYRLIGQFYSADTIRGFAEGETYFVFGGQALHEAAQTPPDYAPKSAGTLRKNGLFAVTRALDAPDSYIVYRVPLDSYYRGLWMTIGIAAGLTAVCILLSWLIARRFADRTTQPLNRLEDKISRTRSKDSQP